MNHRSSSFCTIAPFLERRFNRELIVELCPAWRWSSTGPVYPWDTVVNINEVIAREVDGLDGTEMTCPDEVVDEHGNIGYDNMEFVDIDQVLVAPGTYHQVVHGEN